MKYQKKEGELQADLNFLFLHILITDPLFQGRF